MNLPWWVFRIWQTRNSSDRPLNTYKSKNVGTEHERIGEAEKLDSLIEETIEQMPDGTTRRDAERIVAYAWALYVHADPEVYDDNTKFPLSSFIEMAQGYILTAFDGIHKVNYSSRGAEKAFKEHGLVAR